jgi:capsular polysaccharide export protein
MNTVSIQSRLQRKFLFLQGPHGPFFYEISRILMASGAAVQKIGFNKGDEYFWRDGATYTPFHGVNDDWAAYFRDVINNGVTDIVIYGDARFFHVSAIEIAKEAGITVHCFEEGYIRPYWVTYERGGVNGNSRIMSMPISEMRSALKKIDDEQPEAPARWGELRNHMFYGAWYHFHVLFRNGAYPNYKTHRTASIRQEFSSHAKRLFMMPWRSFKRAYDTARIIKSGYVYHLAMLQLGHDASIVDHSPYMDMEGFMRDVVEAFALKAPGHHHLIFKAHPLEDYRVEVDKIAFKLADEFGLTGRVHFLNGGKLAELLGIVRSVVTVNSTGGQQALRRGLPVKTLGDSVYSKPELTSHQSLASFFKNPHTPDLPAYLDYRRYLLATSQITGGFYSKKSRVRLIRQSVDMVLSDHDPYQLLSESEEAPMQQIKLIK